MTQWVNTLAVKMAVIISDNIFKLTFLSEKCCILIEITLKFIPKVPIYKNQFGAEKAKSHYLN